jgi:hypothetical protein
MAGPPCKCTQCGHVFQTGQIEIGPNVAGVTFQGCATDCPKCGGRAHIADGTYSSTRDRLRLDVGPLKTLGIINELNRLAEKARAEHLSAEEVLAELADISPDLAKKLKSIGPWPVVGLAILLFWLVKSFSLDLHVDVNWLIDEAWHVSHGDDPIQHIGTDPPEFHPEVAHRPIAPKEPTPFERVIIQSTAPNRHARRRAAATAKRRSARN